MNNDFIIKDNVLLRYTGKAKEVIVPEEVIIINESAFSENDWIEKVILPKNLKQIDRWAFEFCSNLKEIILPDNLEYIGDAAISECNSLEEIIIPPNLMIQEIFLEDNKKLKKIIINGNYSFVDINYITGSENPNLTEVIGPNIVCEDGIIYNKDKTTIISCLEGRKNKIFKIPHHVKKICTYSFTENKYLKELYLNKNLQEIETNAISTNTINKITIPANLTAVENLNFYGKEKSIKITIEGSKEQLDKNIKLKNILKTIKNVEFKYNKTLEELIEEGKTFREASQIIKKQER